MKPVSLANSIEPDQAYQRNEGVNQMSQIASSSYLSDSFEASNAPKSRKYNAFVEVFRTFHFTSVNEPVFHRRIDIRELMNAINSLKDDFESGIINPNAPLPNCIDFCHPEISPLAAAARIVDEQAFRVLMTLPKIDPYGVDSKGVSVLMHAVEGAESKNDTVVLNELLKHIRVTATDLVQISKMRNNYLKV